MERVTVFRSYRDSARILAQESTEAAFEYIMAVLAYGLDDEEPDFTSRTAEAMFVLTKPTLENSRAKAKAGAAGGRADGKKAGIKRITGATGEQKEDTKGTKLPEPTKRVDYEGIVAIYHEECKSYPRVKGISEARKKAIAARLKEYSVDELKECFRRAEESDFLKGKNAKNWSADFDWLMKSTNIPKVLEGKYDNKKKDRDNNSGVFAPGETELQALRNLHKLRNELRGEPSSELSSELSSEQQNMEDECET